MIEVQGVTKYFGNLKAVDDVTFTVAEGDVVGFLGPNGAGKTTTMRIITGALPATTGKVTVAGFDVFEKPLEVKKRIGYLPEHPPLYLDISVRDYLRFVGSLKGLYGRKLKKELDRVMELTKIKDVEKRLIGHLSKGYRQRVGIAQALLGNPQVLILDEPTIGLDPNQIMEVRKLIKELAQEHTVILSTHILPEVEMTCRKVIIISRGRIVAEGDISEILQKTRRENRISVRLMEPADGLLEKVRTIPGVKDVVDVSSDKKLFTVVGELSDTRRAELTALLASESKLVEFKDVSHTLEDVFRELTQEEEEVAA